MTSKQEYQQQIEEFIRQGGEVTEIPRGKSGYVEGQSRSAWGAPRKKAAAAEPVVAAKPQKQAKK
jgi:hypothetical protein